MVGGDAVAQLGQHPGADDVGDRVGRHGQALEEGGPKHVGGVAVPGEGGRRWRSPRPATARPRRTPRRSAGGTSSEVSDVRMASVDLLGRGPQVGQAGPARPSASVPRGSRGQVDVHGAGQGVGHHQRGRGQVVHPHVGVDPALEVAVAREHRRPPTGRLLWTASDTPGSRGPELPMQVVQP